MANWNERFMNLSQHISKWSKDKSIGTCAIIVSPENRILSIGYNGFPSGCDDSIQERYERPEKYLWTEHAERNAIYNSARNGITINNAAIFLRWFPCADCARGIIQSGIKKIVCEEPNLNDERWGNQFKVSLQMFKECGIEVEYYMEEKNT